MFILYAKSWVSIENKHPSNQFSLSNRKVMKVATEFTMVVMMQTLNIITRNHTEVWKNRLVGLHTVCCQRLPPLMPLTYYAAELVRSWSKQ